MVALNVNETSKTLLVAGGYVTIVGIVSYYVKEKLFMSESLLATLCGIIFGPLTISWIDPYAWVSDHATFQPSSTMRHSLDSESVRYLTLQIARIIIAIQVLFTGVSLPKKYLLREWRSLATLLGLVMITAWFSTSLLVWAIIPGLTFLEALVIGACVTPTDPVLANSICKGRFAEKHVPLHVRNIIVCEAGANDGLGYPFLYLALYLILIKEPSHPWHSVGGAILEWFYNIVLYQIVLSCVLGAIIGYVARKVLRFAEEKQLIDHESFLSFGVALTFFTLGFVGTIGSDDILACFVVGNSFTWDDWFRVETEDHAFQDVIDQLLNSGVFIYIGAVLPWSEFGNFEQITPWRLVLLGLSVMCLRRLPWVLLLSKFIPALPTWRESVFAGFFGPIGVGAVFYTQVALENIPDDGTRDHLRNVITPVNYFLVLTSIVVHGVTIPVGKGFQRARSITQTRSQSNLTSADKVSRLPPPVALPNSSQHIGQGTDPSGTATAIRFDLGDETENGNGSGSGSGTPRTGRSRPGTPKLGKSQPGTPKGEKSRGREGSVEGVNRVEQGRETEEQRMKGRSWREGEYIVTERDNGERVTVRKA